MASLLALHDPLGPSAVHLLAFMGLPIDAPLVDLAAIPESFLTWALTALQVPGPAAAAARHVLREAKGATRRTAARGPDTVEAAPLATLYGARGPPWSAYLPRPGPNRSWPELIAAGHPVSAQAVAQALFQVFTETAELRNYNAAVGGAAPRVLFSFRDRALASNCLHLAACLELDEAASLVGSRHESEPPRKRIARAQDGFDAGPSAAADPRAVRLPDRLSREAGVRVMMASVLHSWRSYASGLRCWGAFMDLLCPAEPHFPALPHQLLKYAPLFRSGKTLDKYMMHVHFAERLCGHQRAITRDYEKAVLRGVSKDDPRGEGPSLRQDACVRLLMAAVSSGQLALARCFAVARAWLLRVPSELLPLQADGRAGLPAPHVCWHSFITVERGPPAPRVRITWKRRKNAPGGDSAVRTCTCRPSDETSLLLCGPCALLGQLRAQALWPPSTAAATSLRAPLFPDQGGSRGRTAFQALAGALGVAAQWHAFRRGMAQDMLQRGDALAEILLAGGWRSGAFLRYLARADLDHRVALEYAMAASDDEA